MIRDTLLYGPGYRRCQFIHVFRHVFPLEGKPHVSQSRMIRLNHMDITYITPLGTVDTS